MTKDRSLDDAIPDSGLLTEQAESFIYGEGSSKKNHKAAAKSKPKKNSAPAKTFRQPYTVKLRTEVVEAIHRIAVFSEFRGDKRTKQSIVEEAIEEWVEKNKHLAEVPSNL